MNRVPADGPWRFPLQIVDGAEPVAPDSTPSIVLYVNHSQTPATGHTVDILQAMESDGTTPKVGLYTVEIDGTWSIGDTLMPVAEFVVASVSYRLPLPIGTVDASIDSRNAGAVTLTTGAADDVAQRTEARLFDENDGTALQQALVDKIAAADLNLADLTVDAIAAASASAILASVAAGDAGTIGAILAALNSKLPTSSKLAGSVNADGSISVTVDGQTVYLLPLDGGTNRRTVANAMQLKTGEEGVAFTFPATDAEGTAVTIPTGSTFQAKKPGAAGTIVDPVAVTIGEGTWGYAVPDGLVDEPTGGDPLLLSVRDSSGMVLLEGYLYVSEAA